MKKTLGLLVFSCVLPLAAMDIWHEGQGAAIVPAGLPASAMPVNDGVITLPSGKYFYTRNIPAKLACSEYKALELEMCSSAPADVLAGIYWRTVENPKLSESRKSMLTIPLNSEWKKVIIPLHQAEWKDNLLDFRLDFRAPAGVKTQLRRIAFVKELPAEKFVQPHQIFPGTLIKGHTVSKFKYAPEKFTFTMSRGYGYTHVVPVNFSAAQGRYLKVVFKAAKASSIRIGAYFTTAEDPKLSDSKSAYKQVSGSDQFQTAIVDLGAKDSYKGVITGIRFDFGAVAGAEFEVKSIQVVTDPTEALPLGWERGINESKSNRIATLTTGKIYRVMPVHAGMTVNFFDALGNPAGKKVLDDGTFFLQGNQALAQISVPRSVPAVEMTDTGKFFTPWQSQWIAPAGKVRSGGRFVFRKEFTLSEPVSGRIRLTADDGFILKINGVIAAERMDNWRKIMDVDCSQLLKDGKNQLSVEVINSGDWGGLLLTGGFVEKSGRKVLLHSDRLWQAGDHAGNSYEITSIGVPPVAPWGKMEYQDVFASAAKKAEVKFYPHEPLPATESRLQNSANGIRVMKDGKIIYLCGFKTSYHAPEQHFKVTSGGVADFQAAGSYMYFNGSLDKSRTVQGELDFSVLEERIKNVLAVNPRARLMISIGIDAPEWFADKYPGELTTLADGTRHKLSSPASELLKKENEAFLKAVIAHLEKSPYAGNIITYRAVSQCDGGEYQYFTTWKRDFDGYSPAMQAQFRSFLQKKYGTSEALSKAWGRNVTLESVTAPAPERRTRTTYLTFRDPAKDREVLDFIDCQAEVMVNWAIYHNRIIRAAVPDKLIASYGGYTMFYMQPQLEKSGHLAFNKLLDSGLVNIYTPPQDYNMRSIGDPAGSMVPHASVRLRGQKIYSENDSRTHFGGENGQCHSQSLFEDIGLLKRDFAFNLLTDSSTYFYDMTGSWFGDDELLKLIGEFRKIGTAAQNFRTASVSKVALFNDTGSMKLISPRAIRFSNTVLREVRRELNSAGAGIADEYYLTDILRDDFPIGQYKVLVFPNIFNPSAEIRQAIEKKCRQRGVTLVFGYGAGMFLGDKLDPQGMKQLTGMDFKIDGKNSVTVNGDRISPAVLPAAMQVKNAADHRVVYLPDPAISRHQWRKILQDAGVHVYVQDGDPVFCNGRFLSIHAASGGRKLIELTEACNVYDLFRQQCVAENVREFSVEMLRGETNIYFLGTPEDYQKFKECL